MPDNNTTVTQIDKDIETLLQQPGAESIITATPGEKKEEKPSFFQRKQVDLTFLDNPDNEGKSAEEIAAAKKAADDAAEAKKKADIEAGILNPDGTPKNPTSVTDLEDIINSTAPNQNPNEDPSKGGRPKVDKNGLYEMTKKLIEKKLLIPFDDEKKLEDYTIQDYEELYEANDAEKQKKLEKEVPVKFFDSLPDKLKSAAAYVANGGTDLKSMFRALAEYEEVAELDPNTEHGQEAIARQYLQSTKFGTAEEIEAQVNEWKDHEILDKKAAQFKPKLDTLKEQYVAHKVQEQEKLNKQRQDQANAYMENVYKILEPGELNGIKMDKKIQSMLYAGLIQPNYPSISGKNTNLLGHLLEKYQFVEPKHDLIAEALWLLADPEGYKNKIKEGGKKEQVASTVRSLKTAEKDKIQSSIVEEGDDTKTSGTAKIPRPSGQSFFKR